MKRDAVKIAAAGLGALVGVAIAGAAGAYFGASLGGAAAGYLTADACASAFGGAAGGLFTEWAGGAIVDYQKQRSTEAQSAANHDIARAMTLALATGLEKNAPPAHKKVVNGWVKHLKEVALDPKHVTLIYPKAFDDAGLGESWEQRTLASLHDPDALRSRLWLDISTYLKHQSRENVDALLAQLEAPVLAQMRVAYAAIIGSDELAEHKTLFYLLQFVAAEQGKSHEELTRKMDAILAQLRSTGSNWWQAPPANAEDLLRQAVDRFAGKVQEITDRQTEHLDTGRGEQTGELKGHMDGLAADLKNFISEELERRVAQSRVPEEFLLAILRRCGEENVPPEQIPAKLEAAIDELIRLRKEVEEFKNAFPDSAKYSAAAWALVEAGELNGARAELERGRKAVRTLRVDASLAEARLLAQEAGIDSLQIRYLDAASKYEEAVRLVQDHDDAFATEWLDERRRMLYLQGLEKGDNQALVKAIEISKALLVRYPRVRVPLDWASTQNNLGNALRALGSRETGTDRLKAAVEAFQEALKERTRDCVPLDWAGTQNNLGNALRALGEREKGTDRLKAAVEAFQEALKERTRPRVPLRWAMTQNNLGIALRALGEREKSTDRLKAAVEAFQEALKERTRPRVPLQWATTQNNLGNALRALGEQEESADRLDEALAAYDEALKEATPSTHPYLHGRVEQNRARVVALIEERGGTV